MATWERRRDRALVRTDRALADIGDQIRIARRGAGLSLRAAAAAVGLDFSMLSRIERAELEHVTVRQLALAGVSVGLDVVPRAFLSGDPVRDHAHLRLLARLRARLPPHIGFETEVPMPIAGDLRALDARATLADGSIGFEAENNLFDLQAVGRKARLKQRDAGLDRIAIVVRDTERNRHVLRRHREDLRPSFPLDTRAMLQALSRGILPSNDGIIVL